MLKRARTGRKFVAVRLSKFNRQMDVLKGR